MREVAFKRNRWRNFGRTAADLYLCTHAIPVILGPDGRAFVLDRHHLSRALHDEGVITFPISVIEDLSMFGLEEFWNVLESRNWSHPFDDRSDFL